MKRIVISLLALTVLMACNNKKEEKNLASQNTIDTPTDIVKQKNNELTDERPNSTTFRKDSAKSMRQKVV